MQNAVEELTRLIENHEKEFFSISELEFNARPFPEKWSKKKYLGICATLLLIIIEDLS
ncbi:hypothetical protein HPL003_20605 [Paenibacillus terrae HPL-003]|uniref:Uncharacterized protein n=1 Tax=Paenibacillus terrae (strain HPL-003) TaxID=985665 RepID=G7VU39_PAETH|nr:hypothetical protein [Paenibacillus terrae]AET60855.1 hypothetical protein HPL003_20605 [Paenibacillus terrae HPL-003]